MLLRPTILLAATAALAGAASEVHRRDFNLIQGALNSVNTLLQQIDISITSLNSSNVAAAVPQLLQLGQAIAPSLQSTLAQIEASRSLTLDETNGLNTARAALAQNVNLTVSDLIRQKPLFDAANATRPVAAQIAQVRDQTGVIVGAITAKLDPAAPSAADLATQTEAVFNMAIAVFEGQAAAPATDTPPATATSGTSPTVAVGTIVDGVCDCAVTCPGGTLVIAMAI